MKKTYCVNTKKKKAWVVILISDKIIIQNRGHFIIINVQPKIHKEKN